MECVPEKPKDLKHELSGSVEAIDSNAKHMQVFTLETARPFE